MYDKNTPLYIEKTGTQSTLWKTELGGQTYTAHFHFRLPGRSGQHLKRKGTRTTQQETTRLTNRRTSEHTFLPSTHEKAQPAHEKMFNTANYQGNAH